jgi:hypothetical protein
MNGRQTRNLRWRYAGLVAMTLIAVLVAYWYFCWRTSVTVLLVRHADRQEGADALTVAGIARMVFSGRPNPTWRVPVETARKLERLWQRLEPSEAAFPAAPLLGYRGCTLDCGTKGRWQSYGGVVASGDIHKYDPERKFERLLIGSAPANLLPQEILGEIR